MVDFVYKDFMTDFRYFLTFRKSSNEGEEAICRNLRNQNLIANDVSYERFVHYPFFSYSDPKYQ